MSRRRAEDVRSAAPAPLPQAFANWFAARGWHPRAHQLDLLETVRRGSDALLIAPTGGGKTLAGFLPSLIDLAERPLTKQNHGVHTLYVSPLKALSNDIQKIFENHRLFSNPTADSVKRHCTQYRRSDIQLHNKI